METVTLRRFRSGDEFAVSDVICATLAFWKKATFLNVLAFLFELGAVFFLVQSILTVIPEGKSNWYLPLALGLNCSALVLNAAQRRKQKREGRQLRIPDRRTLQGWRSV
ncbi:MAG: hypothetical protein MR528_04335 [Lachnospiraceae bacterium]|nr:hypothetical protein [Lachnospiraceae bacterium]